MSHLVVGKYETFRSGAQQFTIYCEKCLLQTYVVVTNSLNEEDLEGMLIIFNETFVNPSLSCEEIMIRSVLNS